MIKVITDPSPAFRLEAWRHRHIISLVTPSQLKRGELFVHYDGTWVLCKQTEESVPRFIGRYGSITTAIFHANKRG